MWEWHRLAVFGAVLLVTFVVARLVDRRFARRDFPLDTHDEAQVQLLAAVLERIRSDFSRNPASSSTGDRRANVDASRVE